MAEAHHGRHLTWYDDCVPQSTRNETANVLGNDRPPALWQLGHLSRWGFVRTYGQQRLDHVGSQIRIREVESL